MVVHEPGVLPACIAQPAQQRQFVSPAHAATSLQHMDFAQLTHAPSFVPGMHAAGMPLELLLEGPLVVPEEDDEADVVVTTPLLAELLALAVLGELPPAAVAEPLLDPLVEPLELEGPAVGDPVVGDPVVGPDPPDPPVAPKLMLPPPPQPAA